MFGGRFSVVGPRGRLGLATSGHRRSKRGSAGPRSHLVAVVGLLALAGASTGATAAAPGKGPVRVYSFGVVGSGFGPKLLQFEHVVPTPVAGIPGLVIQVVTSNSDTYALTRAGSVWAWGAGSTGELGDGKAPASAATPIEVHFPHGVKIAKLANPMPYDSALAIDIHGVAWGWGFNRHHTVCLPGGEHRTPAPLPLSRVSLASGAGAHSLLDAAGRVYACGLGVDGEIGDGSTATRARPTPVVGLPHVGVASLVTSWQGSGALMDNGAYYDWGFNKAGQLGDGTRQDSDVPVRVPLRAPVAAVSQGGSRSNNGQTLALLADGSLWAWGSGAYGQLGDGSRRDAVSPVAVDVPAGVRFTEVSSGGDASYAIDATGALWTWGGNQHGQLGDGTTLERLTPGPTGLVLQGVSTTATNAAGLG